MLLLLLSFLSFAQNIILVEITDADLETFGSWPIQRKWYTLLNDRLIKADAKLILYNIQFMQADHTNPQSDQLLFSQLQNPKIKSLHSNYSSNDSLLVLGNRKLAHSHFFPPDQQFYSFVSDGVISSNTQIFPEYPIKPNLYYSINKLKSVKQIRLQEAIFDSIDVKNKTIIIGTALTGISSFYSFSENKIISNSSLLANFLSAATSGMGHRKASNYWLCIFLIPFIFLRKVYIKQLLIGYTSLLILWFVMLTMQTFYLSFWASILPIVPLVLYGIFAVLNQKSAPKKTEQNNTVQPNTSQDMTVLQEKLRFYEAEPILNDETFEKGSMIYAANSPLKKILHQTVHAAQTNISIIIFGESGTGKEELAHFVHANSNRAKQPFRAINCASFTESLLESELFGHEKGAFTGAVSAKKGVFELADGGTLFLDEVGDMPASVQVKLLRVLQDNIITRVGGSEQIKTDVRIVSATNKSLKKEMSEARFREDLYYRLAGFVVELPALKQRKMDIRPLAFAHIQNVNPTLKLTDELLLWLEKQPWAGNIRQLFASIERASINASSRSATKLVPADFQIGFSEANLPPDELAEQILELIKQFQFEHKVIHQISTELGIHRVTATEYVRGWVLHAYVSANFEHGNLATFFNQTDEKIEKRCQQYIDLIVQKCLAAKKEKKTFQDLKKSKFKSLPALFLNDLEAVYNHV